MPEFKEWKGNATKWSRFDQVVINNPLGSAPYVTCREQEVVELGGDDRIVRNVAQMNFAFDPAYTFPVLDPLTNEPTGQTATMGDVYALVYSGVLAQAQNNPQDQGGEQ